MKYILEFIDRDSFIEYLPTQYENGSLPKPHTTMNAFKAEVFTEEDLDSMDWVPEHIKEHFGAMVKVVRIL